MQCDRFDCIPFFRPCACKCAFDYIGTVSWIGRMVRYDTSAHRLYSDFNNNNEFACVCCFLFVCVVRQCIVAVLCFQFLFIYLFIYLLAYYNKLIFGFCFAHIDFIELTASGVRAWHIATCALAHTSFKRVYRCRCCCCCFFSLSSLLVYAVVIHCYLPLIYSATSFCTRDFFSLFTDQFNMVIFFLAKNKKVIESIGWYAQQNIYV